MIRLPIVTFHSIDPSGSAISMSQDELSAVLTGLARDGWHGSSLSQAMASARDDDNRQRRVGLCFDDGYRSVLQQGLPVLRDLGFAATVFVIAGRCGLDNRWPGQAEWVPPLPLLGWDEIETLTAAGWEIGSHGLDHRPLTMLDATAADDELAGSRDAIQERLGAPVHLLAYPYGEHDEETRRRARNHYRAAFGVRLALAQQSDLEAGFAIPRIDAHYLRRLPPGLPLDGVTCRSYIALRRSIRDLRGAHWSPASSATRTSP